MNLKIGTSKLFIAIVACTLTVVSTSNDLPTPLTDGELFKIFRTTRDNVAKYEVAPIMHNLYKRSSKYLRMRYSPFGRDFDIHLNPSDGFLAGENTPVWLASLGSNGTVNYKKLSSNIVGSVATSFVDARPRPSFVVDNSTNRKPPYDWIVECLPDRVQNVTKEKLKSSTKEVASPSRTPIQAYDHVNIKSNSSSNDSIALERKVDEIAQHFNETGDQRIKYFANDTIYPSILIVTDYMDTPRTQNEGHFRDMILYQLAFWNAVDLRFRELESPKVRLRIAGMVIGQGRPATPYINKFLVEDNFNCNLAIKDMKRYWGEQASNPDFKPDAYDVVITLTDANMHTNKSRANGIGAYRSLCKSSPNRIFRAAGIVHDNQAYTGIKTASHELGHVFGASDDDNETSSCSWTREYIMSAQDGNLVKFHWSSCSRNFIKKFLRQNKYCAEQPANFHDPGSPIDRIAPGDILTAEQQCRLHNYLYTCPPDPTICLGLACSNYTNNGSDSVQLCSYFVHAALDGTPCAPNATCILGKCRKGNQTVNIRALFNMTNNGNAVDCSH